STCQKEEYRYTLPAALLQHLSEGRVSVYSPYSTCQKEEYQYTPGGRVSVYSPCRTCQKEEFHYTLPAALSRRKSISILTLQHLP
ncbi:hypothetical protein AVEN_38926-1, partial [Araneus ventricosus]